MAKRKKPDSKKQQPAETPPESLGVEIAIRDFALPVPRTGSIESHSGYGRQQEGQEIHLRIQEKRAKESSHYEAEVMIAHEFESGGYRFKVGGRMDGFFAPDSLGGVPTIEEIKSSFSAAELVRKLSQSPEHPYCLQLRTYGYFYWLQNQVKPKLSFHLVSTRNYDAQDLEIDLNVESYERWLALRLEEMVKEADAAVKRSARRKKISDEFVFPFLRPRNGQTELIASIEDGMKAEHRMLIQAPTGLGKTVGVLYPAMKEALARGQKVIYVTPKNSQHGVAEDAMERFDDNGSPVKSLTITAKSKICFKAEPLCNPEYCEYAKDHYTKVYQNDLLGELAKKKKLTSKVFRQLGEDHQVCPFELQLDAAREADAVICDYNYVFAPRVSFGRMTEAQLGQQGKPNLVIDEAHNLPSRAMDYYSPALSSIALEKMRDDVRELPTRFRIDAEELLDDCIQAILSCKPADVDRPQQITPPIDPFLDQESKLRSFLSKYLESDVEIKPRDVVLRLSFYWSEFTAALEYVTDPSHTEFFTTFHPHPSGGTIKITCCDASEMLQACYDEYEHVVGFSATLKPFSYYAKLSGLESERLKTAEFQSPFAKANRKLLIIPQISTKFSDRTRSFPRIAETILRISKLKPGNYFVFFPSFAFMESVFDIFQPPEGFTVLRQERDMRASDVEKVLEHLRSEIVPTIVFAVSGGIFSEGVDYPGKMIIGAFVIGPPLPSFDLERERMREYYQTHYNAGFDYAYTFPAMSKAVQAAGRVIRSETDRGIIVLIDSRFVQQSYSQSMPTDWFDQSPRELVSQAILKDVSEFWDAGRLDA